MEGADKARLGRGFIAQLEQGGGALLHHGGVLLCHIIELRDADGEFVDRTPLQSADSGTREFDMRGNSIFTWFGTWLRREHADRGSQRTSPCLPLIIVVFFRRPRTLLQILFATEIKGRNEARQRARVVADIHQRGRGFLHHRGVLLGHAVKL